MMPLQITEEQRSELAAERYDYPDPRVQRKIDAVYLFSCDLSLEQVARITHLSQRTIRRYIDEYTSGGIDSLKANRYAKPTSQLDEHTETLKQFFMNNPPQSIKHAQSIIEERTGLKRSCSQIKAFFQRIGMKYLKCMKVPGKLTDEKKKEQSTYVDTVLNKRLAEAKTGERQVLFLDASHFLYGSAMGWLWCFVRILLPTASGRQRYNVLAAMNFQTKAIHTVSNTQYINSTTVVELLEKIAKQYQNQKITIFLDNAPYQRCHFIQAAAERLQIELAYLPSYSPNLNLIERFWRFVKKECICGRYYSTFVLFQQSIDRCIEDAGTIHRAKLETLITDHFQLYPLTPALAA